jgi:hypothetical protein
VKKKDLILRSGVFAASRRMEPSQAKEEVTLR